MATIIRPIIILLLISAAHLCEGHYNLKSPSPYNKISCKASVSWCKKACPPMWKNGKASARNSPNNPSAVWRRGQIVTIEWHKNNHVGGFYRRSLVPVEHMFDPKWHRKTAFEFGCWTQGTFQCGKAPACGSDKQGRAYRNQMKVPNVFPDGDYVFAMVWYGGFDWRRDRAVFSDYHACSFVRISGGLLKDSHTPIFESGASKRKDVPSGTCATTSSFENECGGGPCKGKKPRTGVPGEFQGGGTPAALKVSMFGKNVKASAPLETSSMEDEKKAIEEDNKDSKKDEAMANTGSAEISQSNVERKKGSVNISPKNNQNSDSKNNRSGGDDCSGRVPPKPKGSWGRKNSNKWRNQRNKWRVYRNFCKKCRRRC